MYVAILKSNPEQKSTSGSKDAFGSGMKRTLQLNTVQISHFLQIVNWCHYSKTLLTSQYYRTAVRVAHTPPVYKDWKRNTQIAELGSLLFPSSNNDNTTKRKDSLICGAKKAMV